MKTNISTEMMLRIIKVVSSPILGYPLPPDTKRIIILRRQILKILSLANAISVIPAMVLNMINNKENYLAIFLNCTELIAVLGVLTFILVWHVEANHLDELLTEMTLFFKKTTNDEMDLIQLYLKKPFLLHMMVLAAGAAAPLVFILKSGFQQHPLPARAAYPFSIEPFWVRALLSGSHFIVAIQVIAAINSTMLFVIPTWFAAARFEIVGMNIKKATNENEVKICLRRHQESLDYANRLAATVGRMAFGVAASNFLGVIFGGLVITYKQFYSIDFIHVILFITIAMVHLFLYAWPADHLTQSSIRVSESIFYGQWIGKPPRMHSSILIMMLRANDPVVIKVDGLLPALNVESFGVGLSSSFSYVATLLAILGQ